MNWISENRRSNVAFRNCLANKMHLDKWIWIWPCVCVCSHKNDRTNEETDQHSLASSKISKISVMFFFLSKIRSCMWCLMPEWTPGFWHIILYIQIYNFFSDSKRSRATKKNPHSHWELEKQANRICVAHLIDNSMRCDSIALCNAASYQILRSIEKWNERKNREQYHLTCVCICRCRRHCRSNRGQCADVWTTKQKWTISFGMCIYADADADTARRAHTHTHKDASPFARLDWTGLLIDTRSILWMRRRRRSIVNSVRYQRPVPRASTTSQRPFV